MRCWTNCTKRKARISLLSLLINSECHQELLLKVLNEAHVPQDITPAKFGGIINSITASHHLSFFEEEVSIEGKSHNQPLHIAVKCGNYMIARVMIDNGSSFNVMPKTTLDKLYSPGAILRNSPVVVRAFDGSKREVMGEITLPIRIEPTTFDITFQVIDIQPTYNYLLGRPWIHAAVAAPSSLHLKIDGQLISIMGEREMIVSTPFPTKYIKGDEEALETSFQALEIVGTTSIEAKRGDLKSSKAVIMVAKVLIRRARLDYSRVARKGKLGWKVQGKQQIRSNLHRHFTSGGIMTPKHVTTVEDQSMEPVEWVHPMARELDNWTAKALHEPVFWKIPNKKTFPQINNAALAPDDAGKSSRGEETREIRIGKLIPSDFKQGLTELLREYEDIFAWSYQDMPRLDTAIVEHRHC
ncbi:hypothetical protein CR513_52878, partial [Mucuna pruriens]